LSEHEGANGENQRKTTKSCCKRTSPIEWLQFIANFALAIIGVIALFIYGGQLNVMKGQLAEIIKQYPELQKSADAAKTASEIAEVSTRPWIKIVGATAPGNNALIPALSFSGFGHGVFPHAVQAVTLQIKISLKNVGHSVADVSVVPELYLPLWQERFADDIRAEQKRFCDIMGQEGGLNDPVQIIFPDEPFELHAAVPALITPRVIDHPHNLHPGDFPPIIKTNPDGYVLPTLILCVNYRLGGSKNKTYQTRALFELIRKDDRTRFFDLGVDAKERDIELLRSGSDAAY
jgi:hypothetical protein